MLVGTSSWGCTLGDVLEFRNRGCGGRVLPHIGIIFLPVCSVGFHCGCQLRYVGTSPFWHFSLLWDVTDSWALLGRCPVRRMFTKCVLVMCYYFIIFYQFAIYMNVRLASAVSQHSVHPPFVRSVFICVCRLSLGGRNRWSCGVWDLASSLVCWQICSSCGLGWSSLALPCCVLDMGISLVTAS